MKAPFKLPVFIEEDYLLTADNNLLAVIPDATQEERGYIVERINDSRLTFTEDDLCQRLKSFALGQVFRDEGDAGFDILVECVRQPEDVEVWEEYSAEPWLEIVELIEDIYRVACSYLGVTP